jgi:hypothetical protein
MIAARTCARVVLVSLGGRRADGAAREALAVLAAKLPDPPTRVVEITH